MRRRPLSALLKRGLDVAVAAVALVVLAPLLVLIAMAIRVGLGAPVIFRQLRPGRHGRPFELVKFRTMRNPASPDGPLLPDEERMTRLGGALRKSSLDELPELWNVLRGDMSLVGPRPLLTEYLPLYTHEQARRHEVRPGITGWAQINGRNAISWEEKFALDNWYVDHWSIMLDVKIMVKTVHRIVKREGISGSGAATMERFTGSHHLRPVGPHVDPLNEVKLSGCTVDSDEPVSAAPGLDVPWN